MNMLQQVSIAGLAALFILALILVGLRIVREGVSLKRGASSGSGTAFGVFAECIPLRYPRIWAAAYFFTFIVLVVTLFGSSPR
jgi:hypothetical protein